MGVKTIMETKKERQERISLMNWTDFAVALDKMINGNKK